MGSSKKQAESCMTDPDQRYIVASPPNLSPFNILQGILNLCSFRFENINTNKVKKILRILSTNILKVIRYINKIFGIWYVKEKYYKRKRKLSKLGGW